jgi:hypothetical protein
MRATRPAGSGSASGRRRAELARDSGHCATSGLRAAASGRGHCAAPPRGSGTSCKRQPVQLEAARQRLPLRARRGSCPYFGCYQITSRSSDLHPAAAPPGERYAFPREDRAGTRRISGLLIERTIPAICNGLRRLCNANSPESPGQELFGQAFRLHSRNACGWRLQVGARRETAGKRKARSP